MFSLWLLCYHVLMLSWASYWCHQMLWLLWNLFAHLNYNSIVLIMLPWFPVFSYAFQTFLSYDDYALSIAILSILSATFLCYVIICNVEQLLLAIWYHLIWYAIFCYVFIYCAIHFCVELWLWCCHVLCWAIFLFPLLLYAILWRYSVLATGWWWRWWCHCCMLCLVFSCYCGV